MILAEMQEPPWPDLWYVGLDSDCLLVRALCPLMAPNQSPLGPNWSPLGPLPLGRLPLDLGGGGLAPVGLYAEGLVSVDHAAGAELMPLRWADRRAGGRSLRWG